MLYNTNNIQNNSMEPSFQNQQKWRQTLEKTVGEPQNAFGATEGPFVCGCLSAGAFLPFKRQLVLGPDLRMRTKSHLFAHNAFIARPAASFDPAAPCVPLLGCLLDRRSGIRLFSKALMRFFPLLLMACSSLPREKPPISGADARRHNFGSILGKDGLTLHGKQETQQSTQKNVRVNKFLWQAALDTFSFMTIHSASPQIGRLTTEWYIAPDRPTIRVRVAVLIRGEAFRSDAVTVVVERQKRDTPKTNAWKPAPFPARNCVDLEVLVVERACKIQKEFLMQKGAVQ